MDPREDRLLDAGLAQPSGLLDVDDAERVGAGRGHRERDRHESVAVRIGLHDRHELRRGDPRGDGSDVLPDRLEVDDELAHRAR